MKVELCVSSFEGLALAKKYNFDRIELCQNLENGGLTPSIGLIQKAKEIGLEIHVLIRPRVGNFIYSNSEKELILDEINEINKLGVAGFVFGALNNQSELDFDFLNEIKALFPKLNFTFHRAFDDLKNPLEELEKLIQLNFKRILTSGGKLNLCDGLKLIDSCIYHAENRIEIMIGGGVNENNIQRVLDEISPDAIHFSGTEFSIEDEKSLFSEKYLVPNEMKIKSILELIKKV